MMKAAYKEMPVLASGGKRVSFKLLRVTVFLSGSTENEDPPYGPCLGR